MAKNLTEIMSRLRLNIAVPKATNDNQVGKEKVLRLNHTEYNTILESLRARVTEIKAKRQQAADKGNETQRKTYGHKEFAFNELIRKMRNAKVLDESTHKNPLSVDETTTNNESL
ncbi:MAG: hypothetical protein ACI391_02775 [Muribaculaceae bacterium]